MAALMFGDKSTIIRQIFMNTRLKCASFSHTAQRNFCISHVSYKGKPVVTNIRKSERMFQKFNRQNERKKKKWYPTTMSGVGYNSTASHTKNNPENARRIKQLNVILYDNITSMINSGEISPELVGVQIEKVTLAQDFSAVLVHWLASGDKEKDNKTQNSLEMCAKRLRAYLASMHIIGNIPNIQFVKDRSQCRSEEVENLLKEADMGPDHLPPITIHHSVDSVPEIKKLSTLFWSLEDPDMKITNTVREVTGHRSGLGTKFMDSPDSDSDIATDVEKDNSTNGFKLKSDIYGLDHESLSAFITHTKRKIKDRHYEVPSQQSDLTLTSSHQHVTTQVTRPETVDFQKYLKGKNVLNKKNKNGMYYDDYLLNSYQESIRHKNDLREDYDTVDDVDDDYDDDIEDEMEAFQHLDKFLDEYDEQDGYVDVNSNLHTQPFIKQRK